MKQNSQKTYAVLTGDIIKSSDLTKETFESVKECLKKASIQLNQFNVIANMAPKLLKGSIEFYRGDSWQLLLTEPKYALRACLFLRAYLKANKGIDTRISVGIGTISDLNLRNISQSIGEAFELSGMALDKLKTRKCMTVALPYYQKYNQDNIYDWLVSIYELSDTIVQQWTRKQAEALIWALQNYKQEEIAGKIKPRINPQTIGKRLRTAGWNTFESVLERIEKKTNIYCNIP